MKIFFIEIKKGMPIEIISEKLDDAIQEMREGIMLEVKEFGEQMSGIMLQYGFNYLNKH